MKITIVIQDKAVYSLAKAYPYPGEIEIRRYDGPSSVTGAAAAFVSEETAGQLRKDNPGLLIVILADNGTDPLRLYRLHPFDALYPQIRREDVWRILTDAQRRFGIRPVLAVGGRTIPLSGVIYASSNGHNVDIVTTGAIYHPCMAFREVLNELAEDRRFVECYRGVIVNMTHIIRLEEENGSLLMSNGEILPVRVKGRGGIERRIAQFCREEQDEARGMRGKTASKSLLHDAAAVI